MKKVSRWRLPTPALFTQQRGIVDPLTLSILLGLAVFGMCLTAIVSAGG